MIPSFRPLDERVGEAAARNAGVEDVIRDVNEDFGFFDRVADRLERRVRVVEDGDLFAGCRGRLAGMHDEPLELGDAWVGRRLRIRLFAGERLHVTARARFATREAMLQPPACQAPRAEEEEHDEARVRQRDEREDPRDRRYRRTLLEKDPHRQNDDVDNLRRREDRDDHGPPR